MYNIESFLLMKEFKTNIREWCTSNMRCASNCYAQEHVHATCWSPCYDCVVFPALPLISPWRFLILDLTVLLVMSLLFDLVLVPTVTQQTIQYNISMVCFSFLVGYKCKGLLAQIREDMTHSSRYSSIHFFKGADDL